MDTNAIQYLPPLAMVSATWATALITDGRCRSGTRGLWSRYTRLVNNASNGAVLV